MVEIISKEVSSADLKETVNKLIPDSIGKDIEKACQSIYPLYDVFVNQVKVRTEEPCDKLIVYDALLFQLSLLRLSHSASVL